MRQWFRSTVLTATTLVLLVCSLRYVTDFWILSFIHSLQIHIGLACVAALLLAMLAGPTLFGAALLVAALGLTGHAHMMKSEFASRPSEQELAAPPALRILSFNILGNNFDNAEAIADTVMDSGADLVVILESRPLETLFGRIATVYPYRLGCGNETLTCDLVILSKTPFLSGRPGNLSDLRRDRAIYARINVGGTEIAVAAAHLTKPYYDEYHQDELQRFTRALRKIEGPLVVAGDFNSAIIAPDMQRFLRANGLTTAPAEPATWPVRAGRLGISIDHIFVRPPLMLTEVTRLPDSLGSNHFGIEGRAILQGQ